MRSPDALSPILTLERDGALYSVEKLEEAFGLRSIAPEVSARATFFGRVFAMSCAGLRELDERLISGDRPSAARLSDRAVRYLPPVHSRSLLVVMDRTTPVAIGELGAAPRFGYRSTLLGPKRAVGHRDAVRIPAKEGLALELRLAMAIAEDLSDSTEMNARDLAGCSLCVLVRDDAETDVRSHVLECIGPCFVDREDGAMRHLGAGAATLTIGPSPFEASVDARNLVSSEAEILSLIGQAAQAFPLSPGDVVLSPPLVRVEGFDKVLRSSDTMASVSAHFAPVGTLTFNAVSD